MTITDRQIKKETPIECRLPIDQVIDHGMTLVHDCTGADRNYLHKVSLLRNDGKAKEIANEFGYQYLSGWVRYGVQFDLYFKEYGLGVASW